MTATTKKFSISKILFSTFTLLCILTMYVYMPRALNSIAADNMSNTLGKFTSTAFDGAYMVFMLDKSPAPTTSQIQRLHTFCNTVDENQTVFFMETALTPVYKQVLQKCAAAAEKVNNQTLTLRDFMTFDNEVHKFYYDSDYYKARMKAYNKMQQEESRKMQSDFERMAKWKL